MKTKACFIAATGQDVGKTTTCLGMLSGLLKRYPSVGFMKPVGQEHVDLEDNIKVDKDVILFKEYFALSTNPKIMSPVIFHKGFTRDFLDEKVHPQDLTHQITSSYKELLKNYPFVLIEGTGHMGVGSITNLNNAQVAKELGLGIFIVVSAGLGSSFDSICLNKALCEKYDVPLLGVILNRVKPEKKEMIIHYFQKALKQWNIPLIGTIPYHPFLSSPTMEDFEGLFQTHLLSGEDNKLIHFENIRLVATSVETYQQMICPNQLIITPASREDIIFATLTKFWEMKIMQPNVDLNAGIILTGKIAPKPSIVEQIKKAGIPLLYTSLNSFSTMKKITSFTAKIRKDDVEKIEKAAKIVEENINFPLFFEILEN